VFTGVSGSGKSSLINEAFLRQYPDLVALTIFDRRGTRCR
jgi:excinuclease UvrABC ATPase subunit